LRSTTGYPGIDLVNNGEEVEGFLFTSEALSDHWATLNEFEDEAYERVRPCHVLTIRFFSAGGYSACNSEYRTV